MGSDDSIHPAVPRATRFGPRGLSLGARLALGFGLIALLFLIANYLSQRNATLVLERIGRSTETSRKLDDAARAITDALAGYQRVVLSIGSSSGRSQSIKALRSAEDALIPATRNYEALRSSLIDGLSPEVMTESALSLQEEVRALVFEARRIDEPLNRYWENFDQLHQYVSGLVDDNWHIGDQVLTNYATTSTMEALVQVRRYVSAYLASPTPQRAAAVNAQEREFIATLDRNAETIVKARSEAWLTRVRLDFEVLRKGLRNVGANRDRIDRRANVVTASIQDLLNLVRTGINEPAARMLAASAVQSAELTQQTSQQMKMASIAILTLIVGIAFLTVVSVTGPIRRLRYATQRLTAGDESARALRGGTRELDELAASFNDMADRLAQTQQEMRNDQARLEERVVERTQQLHHLAYHDTLTQLPNRRHLFKHLSLALERARTSRRRVALLLLDLDNFKTLNDSLGHPFGDRVLKAASERLTDALGANGFAARLGGDEFTVVCEMGVDVAHRAEALLAEFQRPLQVDDREIIVSVSIGAGIFPDHASDAESLLRAADAALFKAKEFGRNRTCVASTELVEQIGGQFRTEQALRRATACNELVLMFQPQLNLSRGKVNVVEALVRWKRGDTLVSPMDFLPLAEQSGLITEITDWVLKESISTLAKWRRGPWPDARVAVNISSQQFMDQAFVFKLQSLLVQFDVPASSLELELTETALQSGSATVNTLRELRKLGVGIALDDFGAGYSSLASLEQLSLSRVKIDRSLIAHVDHEPRSKSIARSIIDLCHSLNMEVTVEGIERREQFHFLRQCEDVDVQGYLFARPLPAEEVLESCDALPARLLQLTADIESVIAAQSPPGSASILKWRGPPRGRG